MWSFVYYSKGKSKEAERKRINKELANIRSKFKSTFVIRFPVLEPIPPSLPPCFLGDKNDGYQKKKYVCKLLFIFLLGNDINFGYQEAVNLLSSIRFSEKQIVSYNQQKEQDSLLSLFLGIFICDGVNVRRSRVDAAGDPSDQT